MHEPHPVGEQDLFSSDTDFETLSSDYESDSSTMEVDDVVLFRTPPKLPPIMSSTMSFIKKVFDEEVINNLTDDFEVLIVGIHAIMLQSGFVCFDPDSGKKIDGFRLPYRWHNNASNTKYLFYTLPQVLELGFSPVQRVVLRFQNSGDLVNVYGSLPEKESVEHQLSLKLNWFVIPLDLAFVNCDMIEERIKIHGSSSDQYPENEVFEFQRLVNDALVYPLSIYLREKAGLVLPPCFTRLPAELKFKIVELLEGVDIARVACVCSELRNLSSDDDLWRRKFIQNFGILLATQVGPTGTWKSFYASNWKVFGRHLHQFRISIN